MLHGQDDATMARHREATGPTSRGGFVSPQIRGGFVALVSHGGSAVPSSRGGSILPTSRGGSTAPSSRGGSVAPSSRGGSVAPSSRRGSVAPSSRGGSVAPSFRGGSIAPDSHSHSVVPTSRTASPGMVSGFRNDSSTTTDGLPGSQSYPSRRVPSTTCNVASQSQTLPGTPPSSYEYDFEESQAPNHWYYDQLQANENDFYFESTQPQQPSGDTVSLHHISPPADI